MDMDATTLGLIKSIYGELPEGLVEGLQQLLATDSAQHSDSSDEVPALWSERDVVLITYADQIRDAGMTPLKAQGNWLLDEALDDVISIVHLLPFCPFTSDDGFSVVDYLAVDRKSGTWSDISNLGDSFDLMFDLVLNHASQKHEWFQRYLAGDPEFADFFISQDPSVDLSAVVRPRSLPLLTPFETESETRYIWTTFSADQVDLNYAIPRVMLRMIHTLVEYARRGARIIRLDAIAFLWKEVGTNCLHHPKTHAAVQLMRRIMDQAAPGTLILTETNVPHAENLSYFGGGDDEAHMVYQFSLPPLLLDAIHSGDTGVLRDWMKTLSPPSPQTTFFNFTASHDGVGVRPIEGIVPTERVQQLVDVVKSHGGRVSMRSNSDGSESPYELNITYIDAVADRSKVSPADHSRRFLATQAIMLSMQGMPAVYFHSLVGSPNDIAAVEESGQNRRINRHKYQRSELDNALDDAHSLQRRVFDGMRRLLDVRCQQPAFHPNAKQDVLDLPSDGLIGFLRTASSGDQILVLANLSSVPQMVDAGVIPADMGYDELAQERLFTDDGVPMRPFQVRWISNQ
ncbi:Sucrose phosphorylase [Rubripirellula lacrimiformis]|uniref:Sucrose phosphorylase n=1 Tax=Rubripirellula lacrimiformis TaxID=1930273 RepID=A0A517N6S6_9BACT|nr:sugar phosphorylase [Rubripirellula lacrimiformis]QDT02825.1 Sucrose phosphorylase [Rubripirellula lacrimiformis]